MSATTLSASLSAPAVDGHRFVTLAIRSAGDPGPDGTLWSTVFDAALAPSIVVALQELTTPAPPSAPTSAAELPPIHTKEGR
jgi:hypothetical protein